MTNNSNNRSYVPLLLILLFLLIAGFTAFYFLYLKTPHLVYIELPHPLPLSQGDSRQLTAIGIYSDKSKKDIGALVTWRSSDTDVAQVDNSGFVKSVSAGKTIITATNFKTGLSAETTLKVMEAGLVSIAIYPDANTISPGNTIQFKATGTYGSGQTRDITDTAVWETSDHNIAVFQKENPPGKALSLAAGIVTISATDIKSGNSGQAVMTVSEATLIALEIITDNTTIPLGKSIPLTVEGTFSDDSKQDISNHVSWEVKNKSIVEVNVTSDGKAMLVSKAAGSTLVTAQYPGTEIKDDVNVSINKAQMVSLKIIRKKSSIPLGSSLQFMAKCKFSDGSTHILQKSVDWSSSDPSVVRFSTSSAKKGLAVSRSAGFSVITATDPKSGITNSTRLVVKGQNLLSISISPENPSIALGQAIQLQATGRYSDGSVKDLTNTLTWTTQNPFVASSEKTKGRKGNIASFSEGSSIITAADSKSGVSGKTLLIVTPPKLIAISITPTSPIIPVGDTVQLTATGSFTDGSNKNVTDRLNWTTENITIAAARTENNLKGKIKGATEGETVVIALDPASGASAKAGITVSSATLSSITVKPAITRVPLGKKIKIKAIGSYTDGSTSDISSLVEWSSSDSSIASIDNTSGQKGTLKTLSTGSFVVTASYQNAGVKGKADLQVIDSALESITLTPINPTLYIGKMKQFTAVGSYSNGSKKTITERVKWSSSDPTLASVRNSAGREGLANSHAVGKVTITATDQKTGIKGSTTLVTKVKW